MIEIENREEIIHALIEHSSWPITLLVCLLLIRKELSNLLFRLKGFKAGTIELQMSDQLNAQGLPKKQFESITSLSADEIDLFLLVSFMDEDTFKYDIPIPSEVFKKRMHRLQEAGLIEIVNIKNPENTTGVNITHKITPLGTRVRGLLIGSTAQLLRGIAEK